MPSTSEIHGHEIIRLVNGAKPPLTRAQLLDEAQRRFGQEARFCTCSAQGMTLEQLLTFLASRGKVVEQGGRMVADIGQICSGEDDHHHEHEESRPA